MSLQLFLTMNYGALHKEVENCKIGKSQKMCHGKRHYFLAIYWLFQLVRVQKNIRFGIEVVVRTKIPLYLDIVVEANSLFVDVRERAGLVVTLIVVVCNPRWRCQRSAVSCLLLMTSQVSGRVHVRLSTRLG